MPLSLPFIVRGYVLEDVRVICPVAVSFASDLKNDALSIPSTVTASTLDMFAPLPEKVPEKVPQRILEKKKVRKK